MEALTSFLLPSLIALSSLLLLILGSRGSDALSRGVKSGLDTAKSLAPALILLLSGVAMLEASGLTAALCDLLAKPASKVGIPSELLPLLLIRPFSGAGGNVALADLFSEYGPDSPAGIVASVVAGSSDTLFYVTALYFAAGKAKRSRYLFPVVLAVSLVTLLLSVALAPCFFPSS